MQRSPTVLTELLSRFIVLPHNHSLFVLAFLIFIASVVSCARPPTIMRSGVEVSVEEAARLDYMQGERLFQQQQYAQAHKYYVQIINQMPLSAYADNSMLRVAQILKRQKDTNNAINMLEALISRYSNSDVLLIAQEELGRLYHAKKDYGKAAAVMSPMSFQLLPPSKRNLLIEFVTSLYDLTKDDRGKLFWFISLYHQVSEAPLQNTWKIQILTLLDQVAKQSDLESIATKYESRFPAGYACFKLAKLSYHMGNLSLARHWITTFLNHYPSHEYTKEAVLLSESLMISDQVNSLAVGLLVSKTGSKSVYDTKILNGMTLAMNVFKKQNVNYPEIKVYTEDVGDDPATAVTALEKLLREKHVICVMGPLFAKQSQAVALAAQQYELPVISMTASEGITEIGKTVFRNSLTKSEQAQGLAHLASTMLGIRRAAVLYPDNAYGQQFTRLFIKEFEGLGGEIRRTQSYDSVSNNITTSLKQLVGLWPLTLRRKEICSEKESRRRNNLRLLQEEVRPCYSPDQLPPIVDFEALFVPDGYATAIQILPMLKYYDIHGVQVLGTNLWNTSDIFRGKDEEALQGIIFLDAFFENNNDPVVVKFMEEFKTMFDQAPGILEAQAYDTLSMVLHVLTQYRPKSREAFVNAFQNITEFPGVTGKINISSSREAHRKLIPLIIDDGQIVKLQ